MYNYPAPIKKKQSYAPPGSSPPSVPVPSYAQPIPFNGAQNQNYLGVPAPLRNTVVPTRANNLPVPNPQNNQRPNYGGGHNFNAAPSQNYMGVPTPIKNPSVPNPQHNQHQKPNYSGQSYMGVPTPIKTPSVPNPQHNQHQQPNYGGGQKFNPPPSQNNLGVPTPGSNPSANPPYNQQPNYGVGQNFNPPPSQNNLGVPTPGNNLPATNPQNIQQPNYGVGHNPHPPPRQNNLGVPTPGNNLPATNPQNIQQPNYGAPRQNNLGAPTYGNNPTDTNLQYGGDGGHNSNATTNKTMAVVIPEGMTPGNVMKVQIIPNEIPKEVTVPAYTEWKTNEANKAYFVIPIPQQSESMAVPIPGGMTPGNVMKVQIVANEDPKEVTVPAYTEWKSNEANEPYFVIPIPQKPAIPVVQATFIRN